MAAKKKKMTVKKAKKVMKKAGKVSSKKKATAKTKVAAKKKVAAKTNVAAKKKPVAKKAPAKKAPARAKKPASAKPVQLQLVDFTPMENAVTSEGVLEGASFSYGEDTEDSSELALDEDAEEESDPLAEVREVFGQYDKNKNGFIDASEFSYLMDALGADLSDEELEAGLSVVDADKSGRISWKEFAQWWMNRD